MCSENVPEILEHKGKLRTPVFFYVQCVRKFLIIKKNKTGWGGVSLEREHQLFLFPFRRFLNNLGYQAWLV